MIMAVAIVCAAAIANAALFTVAFEKGSHDFHKSLNERSSFFTFAKYLIRRLTEYIKRTSISLINLILIQKQ